jgi:amidase
MASTTRGIAKLLSATYGLDPLDPRQRGVIGPDYKVDYMAALEGGVKGKKIGIVREGFGINGELYGIPSSEKVVDESVREAARVYERLGATVEEVSIPAQAAGPHVYAGIMAEGPTAFLINGNGIGSNWLGYYNTHMGEAAARGMKSHPHDIPHTVMLVILTGEYMRRRYYGRYYGKAQNLRRTITAEFDKAFETYDMLLMPTTPIRASKRVERDTPIAESIASAYGMLRNTCVADKKQTN